MTKDNNRVVTDIIVVNTEAEKVAEMERIRDIQAEMGEDFITVMTLDEVAKAMKVSTDDVKSLLTSPKPVEVTVDAADVAMVERYKWLSSADGKPVTVMAVEK